MLSFYILYHSGITRYAVLDCHCVLAWIVQTSVRLWLLRRWRDARWWYIHLWWHLVVYASHLLISSCAIATTDHMLDSPPSICTAFSRNTAVVGSFALSLFRILYSQVLCGGSGYGNLLVCTSHRYHMIYLTRDHYYAVIALSRANSHDDSYSILKFILQLYEVSFVGDASEHAYLSLQFSRVLIGKPRPYSLSKRGLITTGILLSTQSLPAIRLLVHPASSCLWAITAAAFTTHVYTRSSNVFYECSSNRPSIRGAFGS